MTSLTDFFDATKEKMRLSYILKQLIFSNIIRTENSESPNYFLDSDSKFELTPFIDKKFHIKDWLQVRLLESVGTSKGLDEYIIQLIEQRYDEPGKTASLNYLFATSYLARSLDLYISLLLKNLKNNHKLNQIDGKKVDFLIEFYESKSDLVIRNRDYHFSSQEIEYLRRRILEESINFFYDKNIGIKDIPVDKRKFTCLIKYDEFNIKQFIDISNKFVDVKIEIFKGVIKYTYKESPSLYLYKNTINYIKSEINTKQDINLLWNQIEFLENIGIIKTIEDINID